MNNIKQGARYYSHMLRKGYNASMRLDKTETQFYASAVSVYNGEYSG
jgi:hypothetical protein